MARAALGGTLTVVDTNAFETNASDRVAGIITVQITGTWAGTVAFQATVDGTNYVALLVTDVATGATTTTTTANGMWRMDVSGLTVRVRVTTMTSGTIVVRGNHVLG